MQLGNHLFYTCLKQFHCEEMSHEFLNKCLHRSLKQERCSCCLNLFNSGYHYNSRRPDLPQFIMKVYKEHTRGNCRGANAEYVTCNTQVSFLFFIFYFLFFIFYFFIFYFLFFYSNERLLDARTRKKEFSFFLCLHQVTIREKNQRS